MKTNDDISQIYEKLDEILGVIKILADRQNSQYTDIMLQLKKYEPAIDNRSDEDFYEEAVDVVREAGKASTSFIQRMFGIGYSRAARIIDLMEKNGVIGPSHDNEPRVVLPFERRTLKKIRKRTKYPLCCVHFETILLELVKNTMHSFYTFLIVLLLHF